MARHVVAPASEIAPGKSKIVDITGRSIGVFNVNGEFFALINRCPHEGAPLCIGFVLGRFTRTGPASTGWNDAARCCAVPGTAGSSISRPASPGVIRRA
jgi:3-phenylpropionate/trans-cinnamate dioxygenase ferredoxin subunit